MGKNTVKETAEERAMAEVSIERWNDHQLRMVPLENKVIEDANRSTTAQGMRAAGQVNADVAQATAPALNPNAGSAITSAPALSTAKQAATAQVNAGQNVQDQRASKLLNTVRMGEGKAAIATAGFESAANNASSAAINTVQLNQQARAATANAIGSAIGAGVYAGAKAGAAGKLSDFGTAEGQAAAINGAGTGPGSYRYNPASQTFHWND